MKTIEGDLIKMALLGEFDVIIHGCNCMCAMGAGIAKTMKAVFPEAYAVDCKTESGDKEKLGTISTVTVKRDEHEITIVNGYIQYHWKGKGSKTDYDAMKSVMKEVENRFADKRIGLPLIGAGLAGGDWGMISQIIEEELEGTDHTLVKFKPE